MNKKVVILSTLVIIAILIILSFILIKPKSSNPELELTEDKIINDPEIFDLIVKNRTSPKGNDLTMQILDEDDPNIMDEPWKKAFFVCNEDEHVGWIYYYPGGDEARPELYGPFSWCLQ